MKPEPNQSSADALPHYVSTAPFDPTSISRLTPEQEKHYLASQWRLMWRKFCHHRVALGSLVFLCVLYASIFICEFLSPYDYQSRHLDHIYSPPQSVHMFHEGSFVGPFVYGTSYRLNMDNLKREYTEDQSKVNRIRFFCRGDTYSFWGLVDGNVHLFCPAENGTVFLFGTDRLGRDLFSRMIYGARISLTIGLLGVAFSILLGLFFGGLAGYYGGTVDMLIQRLIEVLQSLPSIPLWLALSAIIPVTWNPLATYFAITLILSLLHWTGLARSVRSKLLALREEDYVLAAQTMGASPTRVITRHLIPGFTSHLIAAATLSIPGMILGETALSFLGLGLRAPITSWGVLLTEAQNIDTVALYPWLLLPAIPVVFVVLAFNFLGDGLRDAADPYH